MDPLGAESWGFELGLGDALGVKGFLSGAAGEPDKHQDHIRCSVLNLTS